MRETTLFLTHDSGEHIIGEDRVLVRYPLSPALNLIPNGAVDYFCALSYLEFKQTDLLLGDTVWLEFGRPTDSEDVEHSPIEWSGERHYGRFEENSIANLFPKIRAWQKGLEWGAGAKGLQFGFARKSPHSF